MAVLDGRIDEKREKLKVLGVTITLIFYWYIAFAIQVSPSA